MKFKKKIKRFLQTNSDSKFNCLLPAKFKALLLMKFNFIRNGIFSTTNSRSFKW